MPLCVALADSLTVGVSLSVGPDKPAPPTSAGSQCKDRFKIDVRPCVVSHQPFIDVYRNAGNNSDPII